MSVWKPTYTYSFNPDELYHHGIAGQKWGHRNGPPYPLSAGAHSAAEKKAGYQRSLSSKAPETQEKGMSALALVYTTYLASYAVACVALLGAGAIADAKANGFKKKCDKEREEAKTDPDTGLKLKSKELTQKEDCKRVNPGYATRDDGSTRNCTNCSFAYEMRRRGYEVQAKLKSSGRSGDYVQEFFPKAKTEHVQKAPDRTKDEDEWLQFYTKEQKKADTASNKELTRKTITALKTNPPGSRGEISVCWNKWSGHSMAWEVDSAGKVSIIDAQTGRIYDEKHIKNVINMCTEVDYTRLDDQKFDPKKIKEAVK